MTSSAPPEPGTGLTEADLADLAARLSGAAVHDLRRGAAGGNNRIYRVGTDAGPFALKVYPRLPGDPRDRLGTEFAGLSFLVRHGEEAVPRPVAADRAAGVALYSWIEGEPPGTVDTGDLDAAVAFVRRLAALAGRPDAAALPPASEACLSGTELVAQLDRRLARLTAAAACRPALAAFLDRGIAPELRRRRTPVEDRHADELALPLRTLSPSDFGFHNAMRTAGGLVFVDFEYFGWDDPVKLAADFVLHPGMRLESGLKRRFLTEITAVFATDPTFPTRLAVLYPLYCLRWCLIVLNEFLPERWDRRAFAGATDRLEAEERQLAKAHALLETLYEHDGRPPYAL